MKKEKLEKIKAFAKERGYSVKKLGQEIFVLPIEREYAPEISQRLQGAKFVNEYSIATMSCGVLPLNEFKEYLNAHMKAAELVSFLNEEVFE